MEEILEVGTEANDFVDDVAESAGWDWVPIAKTVLGLTVVGTISYKVGKWRAGMQAKKKIEELEKKFQEHETKDHGKPAPVQSEASATDVEDSEE